MRQHAQISEVKKKAMVIVDEYEIMGKTVRKLMRVTNNRKTN
jgi:hypothetical protein